MLMLWSILQIAGTVGGLFALGFILYALYESARERRQQRRIAERATIRQIYPPQRF